MNHSGAIRYNAGARALHWAIACLVIANLATGLLHEPLDGVVKLMPVHKSIGLTVLGLSAVRIGWRLSWRKPAFPGHMAAWERLAASATHIAFYGLMLALPLTGWLVSSAGTYPLTWFGLIDIAKWPVAKGGPVDDLAHQSHELLGFAMLALVALHVAAALRHQLILRDGLIDRMI